MASISPFSAALGQRKAKHLLRRTCFNYSKEKIDLFTTLTASEALATLAVPSAEILKEPVDPLENDLNSQYWTSSPDLPNTFKGQGRKRAFITAQWWYNAYNQVSLEHKLTFFLHTCFTTSKDGGTGSATYFYDHLRLLKHYSMGNLKELAKKITLDHAMLFYLDNNANNANNPNENYAREFLELFTILKGPQIGDGNYTNYTEEDVQMAAKVFSGFRNLNDRSNIDPDTQLPAGYADPKKHDASDKKFSSAFGGQTILGRDTAQGMVDELHDFVDMVFAQEATAKSYVRKLYKYFVKSEWSNEVETDVILPLSKELKDNNYEILPVVKKLLASEHFFDADDSNNSDNIVGSIVKSPLQLVYEICSMFQVPIVDATDSNNLKEYYLYFFRNFIHNSCFAAGGLNFFAPDSVAGYAASHQDPDYDRHWFTSTSIVSRYKIIQSFLVGKNLIAGWGRFTAVLDAVTFTKNNISKPSDPAVLIQELAALLYPEDIDNDRQSYFIKMLLGDFDNVYWIDAWANYENTGDDTNVRIRLDALITAMVNAPEFQLM